MELVRGIPITEYCDQHQLDPRQRLELFVTVCRAVQHAHQKGIIHRDLKPSNVLVEQHDVTPIPKIIDFGVAKAINRELTEKTLFTNFAQMIGTPLYMSPEQAELSGLDVDTRSDIYSLGVLLYELLTGTTPFDRERLHAAAYDELRRIIREEEPPRPSVRISSLSLRVEDPPWRERAGVRETAADVATTVTDRRRTDSRRLMQTVRGDLDWIVMTCLEKDRNRRYESASALAADVQRFLDHEPVQARPPRPFAGVRKWSRRHRGLLVATAATVLVSGLILAGSIGWIVRDRAARRSATETAARNAINEATRLIGQEKWTNALASIERAEDVLASSGHAGELTSRAKELRKDIDMVIRLEEIRSGPETENALKNNKSYDPETDTKNLLAFREYGIDVEALAPREVAERIKGSDIRRELVVALECWARWRRTFIDEDQIWSRLIQIARLSDPDPWRDRLREALELENEERKTALNDLAASMPVDELPPQTSYLLAQLLRDAGDPHKAVEILLVARKRRPDDFWTNVSLGGCYSADMKPAQLDEAIRYLTAAQALRPESTNTLNSLAVALGEKGLIDEAIDLFREMIRLKPEEVHGHRNLGVAFEKKELWDESIACYRKAIELRPDYSYLHGYLASAQKAKGAVNEAIASYREAIRLNPDDADAHGVLGALLSNNGFLDDAIPHFREAIRLKPSISVVHENLGITLAKKGLLEEALACYREAIRLDPNNANAHCELGNALTKNGLLDEAIVCYREAIRQKPDFADAHNNLGNVLEKKGLLDDAIDCIREATRLNPDEENYHHNLGILLGRQGLFDEAIPCLREAIRLQPSQSDTHYTLGQVFENKGSLEEAVSSFRKSLELRQGLHRNSQSMPRPFYANLDPLVPLARCLQKLGRVDEAAKLLADFETRTAYDFNVRGVAYLSIEQFEKALNDFNRAFELAPDNLALWTNRGFTYQSQGRYREAVQDFERALALKSDATNELSFLAWTLATASDESVRDGKRAVELTTKAAELTNHKDAFILDKLAVAYAEAGDFTAAVKWANKAIELAADESRQEFISHLEAFKSGRPWRDKDNLSAPSSSSRSDPKSQNLTPKS
jgi:serine/threonine-protein kinase